jgi:predicted nuclease with RNAse H fold
MAIRFAGIDCATQPNNVGIALAAYDGSCCQILEARQCSENDPPAQTIAKWHLDTPLNLIALDAPLGWPITLGNTLHNHSAGSPTNEDPDQLFMRETDRAIYERLKKRPLEVGANLIARTANAALELLEEVRGLTKESIPLAWSPHDLHSIGAIEVYPAATLLAHGWPTADYKHPYHRDGRQRIIDELPQWLDISAARETILASPDVLDAVLCVLTAVDFREGQCAAPTDKELATKEGWIWAFGG